MSESTTTRRAPFWNDWSIRLIGVALLGVILWGVGVGDLARVLVNIRILPVVAAAGLASAILVVRAMRWWVLCAGLGIGLNAGEAVRLYLVGTFVGIATPGRIGDFVKAYYVRDRRPTGGLAAGIASVVYDRFLDLGQICALALGAVVVLPFIPGAWGPPLVGLALLAFALVTSWGPTRRGLLARPLSWALRRLPGGDGIAPPALSAGHTWVAQVLTLAALVLFAVETLVLARAVGISQATLWQLAVLSAAGALVGLAPITIFGIGTRDALFVAAAPLLGETTEALLGLSLLLLSLYALAGILGWWAWVLGPTRDRTPPQP